MVDTATLVQSDAALRPPHRVPPPSLRIPTPIPDDDLFMAAFDSPARVIVAVQR